MIKLTRRTEYGLLAIRYLAERPKGHIASVKDISQHYEIPVMLLAKVMQMLKRSGLVTSIKGMSGGYTLARDLQQVSFLSFVRVFEGDLGIVECLGRQGASCRQINCCDIRGPLGVLNASIRRQFDALSLSDLFDLSPKNRDAAAAPVIETH